jgi:hypothetical protein
MIWKKGKPIQPKWNVQGRNKTILATSEYESEVKSLRKLRLILNTDLSTKINCNWSLVLQVLRQSFRISDTQQKDIKRLDRKIREILTILRHHLEANNVLQKFHKAFQGFRWQIYRALRRTRRRHVARFCHPSQTKRNTKSKKNSCKNNVITAWCHVAERYNRIQCVFTAWCHVAERYNRIQCEFTAWCHVAEWYNKIQCVFTAWCHVAEQYNRIMKVWPWPPFSSSFT